MFFLLGNALPVLGLMVSTAALELQAGYPVLDGVRVNGAGPYRMLVDTGAESTSLRPSQAARMGLVPTYAVELESVAGAAVTPAAKARLVEAGGVALAGVEVLLAEPPALPGGKRLDGVLGQTFLRRTNYWIHYTNRFIAMDTGDSLDGCLKGYALPIATVNGRPAIPVGMGAAGERRLVLDTGASHLILTGPFETQRRVMPASFRSATDGRTGGMVVLPLVTAGKRLWQNVLAGWLNESEQMPGGLFPAHLLRSVYVSNRKQSVLVEPRAAAPCATGPTEPPARTDGATGTAW